MGHMKIRPLSLLVPFFALSACGGETVAIQEDYSFSRSACQKYAEDRVNWDAYRQNLEMDAKERNTRLVENFNRCMAQKNWDMGKPKDVAAKDKPKDSGGGIIDTAKVPAPKTELRNSGIGIGVGPTYQLEEVEVPSDAAKRAAGPRPAKAPTQEPQIPSSHKAPTEGPTPVPPAPAPAEQSTPKPAPVVDYSTPPAPTTRHTGANNRPLSPAAEKRLRDALEE